MAKKRRTEAFYRELVAAYRRSGKTQRAFAAEQGIPAGTLSSWCHKLSQRDAATSPRARRKGRKNGAGGAERTKKPRGSRAAGKPAATRPAFLPVRVAETSPAPAPSSPYEVVLAKGLLRLPADFDAARVGALLRAAGVTC